MADLFRDTALGQLFRLLSANKLFSFPDESDRALQERYGLQSSPSCAPSSKKQGDHSLTDTGRIANRWANWERPVNVIDIPPQSNKDEKASEKDHGDGDGSEVILIDWYGPDDLENPMNWSSGRKLLVVFQICVLNFGIYIGSSIYTPGELDVIQEFEVSDVVATLGLSLFVLGYGLGPMLFSPMSEIPVIGRSRLYIWTLFAFVLLQLPTGFAVNIGMLLFFRFLTGFFGSPVLATGGATIGDIYPPAKVAHYIGIFGSTGVLGPVMGPLVGGFAAQAEGWRWTIWELTWLSAAVLILLALLMPETSGPNILYRRAQRLRKATGNPNITSQAEIDAARITAKDQLKILGRAFTMPATEPILLFVDLYCALIYGVLYIWFESFPLVFGNIYGFDIGQQGLAFLGIFIGGLLTLPCYLLWIDKYLIPHFNKPTIAPEIVLPPSFVGALALPVCLFWYGWAARPDVHWIVPLIGSGSFTISIITLFMPMLSYLSMTYPQYIASVFAGNTLGRASCGVVFPLFARALFENLGIGPGNSLLAGLTVLFMPIPFILYWYGERIRRRSRSATS